MRALALAFLAAGAPVLAQTNYGTITFTNKSGDVISNAVVTKVEAGKLTFKELGGIDFQPVTVLLPGGEEVPFTFSSKQLLATADGASISTNTDFDGSYRAPSYRTSNFLDPKGRGLTTGYSSAVGLVPAGDDEELVKENVKRYVDGTGTMNLSITKVDAATGEFAGVFTAIQPSDTDMGSKPVVDVKVTGQLYGRLEKG